MISLKHPFCNKRLTPTAGMTENECRTLHVYQEPATDESFPAVSSFWTPEPDELATLNAGGSVMLRIIGYTHPPLSMRVSPQHDDAQPASGYVPFVMTSDEFHAMAEEMLALRADKARLDWMEAHPLKGEIQGGPEDGSNMRAWAVSAHDGTLRENLDTLMAATQNAG